MTTRRLAAILCTLTLPFAVTACSNGDDALAEPDLTGHATISPDAGETTISEQSLVTVSTTVSTTHETATDSKKDTKGGSSKKKEPATAADASSSKGPCTWKPAEEGSVGEHVSSYCDGKFASVGIYGTDGVSYLRWDGNDWVGIESAGQTYTGFKCYDGAHLDELGVPAAMKNKMIICD